MTDTTTWTPELAMRLLKLKPMVVAGRSFSSVTSNVDVFYLEPSPAQQHRVEHRDILIPAIERHFIDWALENGWRVGPGIASPWIALTTGERKNEVGFFADTLPALAKKLLDIVAPEPPEIEPCIYCGGEMSVVRCDGKTWLECDSCYASSCNADSTDAAITAHNEAARRVKQ